MFALGRLRCYYDVLAIAHICWGTFLQLCVSAARNSFERTVWYMPSSVRDIRPTMVRRPRPTWRCLTPLSPLPRFPARQPFRKWKMRNSSTRSKRRGSTSLRTTGQRRCERPSPRNPFQSTWQRCGTSPRVRATARRRQLQEHSPPPPPPLQWSPPQPHLSLSRMPSDNLAGRPLRRRPRRPPRFPTQPQCRRRANPLSLPTTRPTQDHPSFPRPPSPRQRRGLRRRPRRARCRCRRRQTGRRLY